MDADREPCNSFGSNALEIAIVDCDRETEKIRNGTQVGHPAYANDLLLVESETDLNCRGRSRAFDAVYAEARMRICLDKSGAWEVGYLRRLDRDADIQVFPSVARQWWGRNA